MKIKSAHKYEINDKVLVKCRVVAIRIHDGGFTYETQPYTTAVNNNSVLVEPSDIKQRFTK